LSLFNELKRRNVIRVAIAYVAVSWLLIQVVETLFPVYGLPDAAIRLVVAILGVGFIPVLVLSWVFELTPEGLKRDSDTLRSDAEASDSGKKLDRIILVVLALALAYFTFDKFVLDPARDVEMVEEATEQALTRSRVESYGEKSIAVLPFVNMSPDPDQAYFADGIAEELLNLLATIPTLRVTSRSSSFMFRGDALDLPEVAAKLNVAHILEGSVRKAGNQVRITVQLIEAKSKLPSRWWNNSDWPCWGKHRRPNRRTWKPMLCSWRHGKLSPCSAGKSSRMRRSY
jgi:TolB-like protein